MLVEVLLPEALEATGVVLLQDVRLVSIEIVLTEQAEVQELLLVITALQEAVNTVEVLRHVVAVIQEEQPLEVLQDIQHQEPQPIEVLAVEQEVVVLIAEAHHLEAAAVAIDLQEEAQALEVAEVIEVLEAAQEVLEATGVLAVLQDHHLQEDLQEEVDHQAEVGEDNRLQNIQEQIKI